MGEYVWTTYTIGGAIKADVVDELEDLIQGMDAPEDLDAFLRADEDSLTIQGECNYGNHDELEAFCAEHGLVFLKTWAAQGGCFDAGMSVMCDDGEIIEQGANDEGEAVFSLQELKQAKEDGKTLDDIIAKLDVFRAAAIPHLTYAPGFKPEDISDPLGLACA